MNNYKKKLIYLIFFGLIFFGVYKFFFKKEKEAVEVVSIEQAEQNQEEAEEVKKSNDKCEYKRYVVQEGDIPADVFSKEAGYDANDMARLLPETEEIYDLTKLVIGREIRFCFYDGEKASYFEYDRNIDDMIVVTREGEDFHAEQKPIDYEVEQVFAEGTIKTFLYADALEKGISEATIVTMADVFSFDVDFTTEIREGDEFKLIYEKRKRFGQEASDGAILGAKFVNEGKTYWAFYFEDGENSGYFDENGKRLQRQFLKAPLSYKYISSGYSGARYHPVTKTVSAHYQIDYAATVGTPVVATARGKVILAGWNGGWGNQVKIQHANGYLTQYAHLSKFGSGVKVGAQVAQGQIIGYVGSTGWSTGPHLDFGMRLNGNPVNPLTLQQPKGDPVSDENRAKFDEMKKELEEKLK